MFFLLPFFKKNDDAEAIDIINRDQLGWNDFFENAFEPHAQKGYRVGRIYVEYRGMYRCYEEEGEWELEVSGKMRYLAAGLQDFPAVGDWVVFTGEPMNKAGVIHGVLPRKSSFSRTAPGPGPIREQIVAANIDTAFLVNALNKDFNLRKIERYLVTAWESGASPVILLSKSDLCEDVEEKVQAVEGIAPGVPIHPISALTGEGMDDLQTYLQEGKTVALMGSSGVGKSSVINHLLGWEMLDTQEVRKGDDRGKHTTTYRELILLPGGGMIIDTPGMRELHLWNGEESMGEVFDDIESLAEECRFADCHHDKEPGCAIKQAIREGQIAPQRLKSYQKLQKEIKHLERKQNALARMAEKRNGKRKPVEKGLEEMV